MRANQPQSCLQELVSVYSFFATLSYSLFIRASMPLFSHRVFVPALFLSAGRTSLCRYVDMGYQCSLRNLQVHCKLVF